MGRYIRQGAKGIALINHSGDAPRLRYVFDVADTRGTERSRSPYLWEFRPEHERVVSHALEQQYSIRYAGDFADQLEQICSVKVTEYFLAHEQDILGIVDGSYLEQYHDYDKGVASGTPYGTIRLTATTWIQTVLRRNLQANGRRKNTG